MPQHINRKTKTICNESKTKRDGNSFFFFGKNANTLYDLYESERAQLWISIKSHTRTHTKSIYWICEKLHTVKLIHLKRIRYTTINQQTNANRVHWNPNINTHTRTSMHGIRRTKTNFCWINTEYHHKNRFVIHLCTFAIILFWWVLQNIRTRTTVIHSINAFFWRRLFFLYVRSFWCRRWHICLTEIHRTM